MEKPSKGAGFITCTAILFAQERRSGIGAYSHFSYNMHPADFRALQTPTKIITERISVQK